MMQTQTIGPIEAAFRAAHAERRARLMGAKTPAPASNAPILQCRPPATPLWRRFATTFSDHVVTWQMHQAAQAMSPAVKFMRDWCHRHGIAEHEMVGVRRTRQLANARQQLIWEIHDRFGMSLPQLGRMFNRDHSTVLHAIRKISAQRGQG